MATLRKTFTIALVFSAAACAADPSLLNLVMPDARVLVGVNVERILSSPIGKEIESKIQGRAPELQQILQKTGFDPTKDLQEILIAATGKGQNGPALFLVRGSFDAAKVSAAAVSTGRTPQTYEGVQIMDNPSESKGAFAFLDETIAVGGDLDQVKAAIRRQKHHTVLNADLASQVASLSDRYDIWVISTTPLSEMTSGDANPQMKQATDLARSIQQLSGGVKFTANLELAAELTTHNDQEAVQLRDTLQLFHRSGGRQQAEYFGTRSQSSEADCRGEDGAHFGVSDGRPTEESVGNPSSAHATRGDAGGRSGQAARQRDGPDYSILRTGHGHRDPRPQQTVASARSRQICGIIASRCGKRLDWFCDSSHRYGRSEN